MRIALLLIASYALSVQAFAQPFRVKVETGVGVKMRDSVTLVADVYRPDAPGRFPVLLQRTPYNRAGETGTAVTLAGNGYVVVVQDTRGRYASEGEFYPFKYESQDGYDTVEWAAGLPYSNGRVGMWGGSYVGATQMLAAIAVPPHLEAIFPYVTAAEYYDGWTYQGGALMQWFTSSWSSGLATDTLRRMAADRIRASQWVTALPVEAYKMADLPPVPELAPYFRDWVAHERDDEYWRGWKISRHYPQMKVKALHAGGWHDIFLKGSIGNYIGMRQSSPARDGQRLLVGPWAHAETSPEGKIGDVVFGKAAVLDMTGTALRWFDYALKGVQNEYASGAPVRIFVMGENAWRDEQEFPIARTQYTKYYLHSAKVANTINGDGVLSTAAPKGERADSFVYDPADPVPTIGGRLCCGKELPPGPADQRPNESRPDVLVFSTPPLAHDLEVTGFIKLELYAATSAPDTDFTALIADVEPSGYSRFLTDGIVRARYRNSYTRAEPVTPGEVYKFTIDLWATSNVFKAGHRIRVYLSSSNFPRFNRNLNTGEPVFGATKMQRAKQTIYHDVVHPSAIILPVIPRRDVR